MAPSAQKQVTQFMSHKVAENQFQPHAAPVSELPGIVRENGPGWSFGDKGKEYVCVNGNAVRSDQGSRRHEVARL
jgi:hypothetical protein